MSDGQLMDQLQTMHEMNRHDARGAAGHKHLSVLRGGHGVERMAHTGRRERAAVEREAEQRTVLSQRQDNPESNPGEASTAIRFRATCSLGPHKSLYLPAVGD